MSKLVTSDIRLPQDRDNRKVQTLIKQLMKVWTNKKVEQNYQNYYLTYLDSLPDHLVQLDISREIKKTLQNKSHYFNISKSLALQSNTVAKLRVAINQLEKSNNISEADLETLCEMVDQLRNNNILVAQNTLNFNNESSSKSSSQFGFVHGNNYIFEKINSDHAFLKTSFLRKYIVFTHSYDPFFLYHYETAKSTNDNKYKRHPCIERLFDLSISKAYKCMKLQQEILSYLSGKVPADRARISKKIKRHNYSLVNDKNMYNSTIRETEAEDRSTNRRLENKAYMSKVFTQPIQNSGIFQRTRTEGEEISRYFDNGIGSRQQKGGYYLPQLKRRQSANVSAYSKNQNKLGMSQQRQRLNTVGNESPQEQVEPITLFNSKLRRNSVGMGKIKDRANQLPLKYSKFQPVNEQMKSIEEEEINQMRGGIQYYDPQPYGSPIDVNDLKADPTVAGKAHNNKNMIHYMGSQLIEQQPASKVPPNTIKNFKLKAGNLSVHSCLIFLRELNVQEKYRKVFQVGNWQHSINNNQYYLHKFYVNEALLAVSLSCALPQGDIVIKYWAPVNECDQQMSNFLFKKYLQHVEKQTVCKTIFYNAIGIPQVRNNEFQQQKERIFRRERKLPVQMEYFSYYPFFSLDFSCVAVPRSTSKDIQDSLMNHSNIYSPFFEKEFFCFNYLLIVNKLINPGQISKVGSFYHSLSSTKEVQTKMLKEELFHNPYNLDSSAKPLNLLTIKMRNPIFSAFFIASRPFIKFIGKEVYSDKDSMVVSLQMLKNNTILYFGKGFNCFGDMMTVVKNPPKTPKSTEFCVRMFSKRSRGRIQSINLRDQVCFGDFEVVFEWRDFLKGKIEHDLSECQKFGEDQSFYCLLEVDGENVMIFNVNETNFI